MIGEKAMTLAAAANVIIGTIALVTVHLLEAAVGYLLAYACWQVRAMWQDLRR